jgi:hypothetical protein
VVHKSVPLELGSAHQIGAISVLSTALIALHSCRKCDVRHVKNLFGKLKIENPKVYKDMMNRYKGSHPDEVIKDLNKYRRRGM